MNDLDSEIEKLIGRLKHFGIHSNQEFGMEELDPNEVRSLLRRVQARIIVLERLLEDTKVSGSVVREILDEVT